MSDLISRQAAIDAIAEKVNQIFDCNELMTNELSHELAAFALSQELIKDLPSADVRENIKGKWIEVDAILQKEKDLIKGNKRYTCSVCGASDTHAIHKEVLYCWFCGADMRGEQDE